ncbi:hypothetical protein M0813_00921 [Anaeramoeba flamelloides]|uniref:Uncharacterized protein n=1 Tax=Anaeramoeba flamelloides TaxID=1746091 RepID=A0ABQ8X069_9EUKA|nr:hypothetical protein M0813_00921 [Anaeramoeba flamelloides]
MRTNTIFFLFFLVLFINFGNCSVCTTTVGDYSQINTKQDFNYRPRTATFTDKSFVVVWMNVFGENNYSLHGNYYRKYSHLPNLISCADIQNLTQSNTFQTKAHFFEIFDLATVSMDRENEFVVVFADHNQKKVYLKTYQIDLEKESGCITNTTDKILIESYHAVACSKIRISNIGKSSDGIIAIVWEEFTNETASHLYVKLFSLDPSLKINSTKYLISDQLLPEYEFPTSSIAKLGSKYFSVAWVDLNLKINLQLFNISNSESTNDHIHNLTTIQKIDPNIGNDQNIKVDGSSRSSPILVPILADMESWKGYQNHDTTLLIYANNESMIAQRFVYDEKEQNEQLKSTKWEIIQNENTRGSLPDVTWYGNNSFAISFETCKNESGCTMENDRAEKHIRAMVFQISDDDQIITKGNSIPYLEQKAYPCNKYSRIVDIGHNDFEIVYQVSIENKTLIHSQQIEMVTLDIQNPIKSPIIFSQRDFLINIPYNLFEISGDNNYQLSDNNSQLPDWFLSDFVNNAFYGNAQYSSPTVHVEINATADICPISESFDFDVKIIEYSYIDIKESNSYFLNPVIYLSLLFSLLFLI